MSKIIYLDYNSTTPIASEVLDAMMPYFKEKYQNPSSKYQSAMEISVDVENARATIAKLLGAKVPEEILFTGSATESINHAIRGTLKAYPNKKHIITTTVEHPAVLETFKDLERDGYRATYLKVDHNGELSVDDLKQAITKDTILVSIMYTNNETGVVFPIDKLSKITKENNPETFFHTDATQAIGKIPINLYSDEFKHIDFFSMSGHKIYAPKGVGILFIRKGARLRKFITGGHHEFNKRGGTPNVPFIIGLAKAFEHSIDDLKSGKPQKLAVLRDFLETELKKKIPYMYVNGGNAKARVFNTSNVSFDCIEGESILFQLDKLGFCVSSGSACTSGSLEPSHVLRAMQVPLTSAHSSIRISIGRYTKKEDIEMFVDALPKIVKRLREISPFWDKKLNKPNEMAAHYSCPTD
ncbi:MAG: aminotransferase class V-fold PLP-dependent enzyme [Proteobacteria bacterium]|nr:aminotransferase class V-fold PLP-dependent enzyme [Pseudomonadota bacterium]